jgi:hypothetical protein
LARKKNNLLQRLRRDESGQAIVFGAITMLFVVIAVIMVFQAGMVVDRRIQAQNAADAAAYSGAATKAMCVNSIEWLNRGMAYIYRTMLRYSYDEMYFSGSAFTGEDQDIGNFAEAHANSSEWIERGMRWMERIGRMEEGIANATPRLIEEEVQRVARLNGARAVTLWPNWPEYEAFIRRDDHLNCVIEKRGSDGRLVASNTDYVLYVERRPQSVHDGAYFEFCMHDNYFAHNGVRASDAVSLRVSGRGPRVNGNAIRFYDGTTYVMSISIRTLDPGPPPTEVLVVSYGDGTEEFIDLKTLQESGTLSLPFDGDAYPAGYPYRYARVTWLLRWMGREGARAELDMVTVDYGNTRVESMPGYTYMSGEFGNSSLRTPYQIRDDGGVVYTTPEFYKSGETWFYQDNAPIGGSLTPPCFVEDTMARFLKRLDNAGVPAPPTIDSALARTRQSDDFFVFVRRGSSAQRIRQNQTWGMYGGEDDYQSVDLARIPLPLSVSEEFFRYGINVGVWMPPEDTIPFFHNPKHGFFAVASARLGKRATASDAMLTQPDDTLLTVELPGGAERFSADAPYSYVKTFENAADRWSRVNTAGPQGYWQPVMVPVKEAILEEDLGGTGFAYSSSAGFVYDKLINSDWYNPATGRVNDAIPALLADIRKPEFEATFGAGQGEEYYEVREWESEPFEYSGEEFDDAVQH